MKIGLDFDGVIADPSYIKQKYIKQKYGVELALGECKRELAAKKGINNNKYNEMLYEIYESELSLKAIPVPGAIENIERLAKQNHIIQIITSRSDKSAKFARNWLMNHKIYSFYNSLINTNSNSKKAFCKDLHIFFDDDYNKLEELVGAVPNLFLLDMPYNKNIKTNSHIKRADWLGFYNWIQNQN